MNLADLTPRTVRLLGDPLPTGPRPRVTREQALARNRRNKARWLSENPEAKDRYRRRDILIKTLHRAREWAARIPELEKELREL